MDLRKFRNRQKWKRWRSEWSQLNLHEIRLWLNKNAVIIGTASAILLIASILSVWKPTSRRHTDTWTPREYYYDLNTGKLFVAQKMHNPPIEAPSGPHEGRPGGVLAHVFTCGDCQEEQWRVGFLEKHTDDAKQAMQALQDSQPGLGHAPVIARLAQGTLVKRPEDADWVMKISPKGQKLIKEATICDNSTAKMCRP